MPKQNVTRGHGFLESFLAKKRINMANSLIENSKRNGRLLDIGCGTYPLFLLNADFAEKFGIEKVNVNTTDNFLNNQRIKLVDFDIESNTDLPFGDSFFDVVTMLSVFEHIEPDKLTCILNEIHRILKPGGKYILTTPATWSDTILRVLATLKLVSKIEIDEHKDSYSKKRILAILEKTHFNKAGNIAFGYFEMLMNIWAVAVK